MFWGNFFIKHSCVRWLIFRRTNNNTCAHLCPFMASSLRRSFGENATNDLDFNHNKNKTEEFCINFKVKIITWWGRWSCRGHLSKIWQSHGRSKLEKKLLQVFCLDSKCWKTLPAGPLRRLCQLDQTWKRPRVAFSQTVKRSVARRVYWI